MPKALPNCRSALWLALLVAAGVAAAPPLDRQALASVALGRLVEGYWQEHLSLDPVQATLLADHRHDGELPNSIGSAHLARGYALQKRSLAELAAIDVAGLSAQGRLTFDAFKWDRELEIEGYRFPSELMPVGPTGGLPQLIAQFGAGAGAQPFATTSDYEAWLRRLEGYVVWLDQAVANLRRGLSRGYVLPRVVVERMLPPLAAIVAGDAAHSLFLRPVAAFPPAVPAAEQARLRSAYRAAVTERITPAYRRLHDFLRREYLPRARESVGWRELPQGREWYAYRVRRATSSTLTPDQIHQLGLDEVRRIGADFDRIAAELGSRGDRRATMDSLRADPRAYYEREQDLLDGYGMIRTRVRARLAELVDPLPRAEFEIRAVPPSLAPSQPAGFYRPPAPDGSRPGTYYVNTSDLKSRPRYEMEALYLREAEPGHLLQVSLQQQTRGLPSFRRYGGYGAFVEGWGAYAESLGRDLGLYADAPSALAALAGDLLRASRLVVDTGLHARGWSRPQALDYLLANTALAATEAGVEVDRIIANPAQGLAGKIGELRIRALRAHAAQALGPRFDVRAFHRAMLADGALPLAVLDAETERWIALQGAAP